MRQPDRRYNKPRFEDRSKSAHASQQPRSTSPKPAPIRRARYAARSTANRHIAAQQPTAHVKSPMTYDDYIKQLGEQEKILELDEEGNWQKIKDFAVGAKVWLVKHILEQKPRLISLYERTRSFLSAKSPEKLKKYARQAKALLWRLYRRFGRTKMIAMATASGLVVVVLVSVLSTTSSLGRSEPEGQVESAVDQVVRELDFPVIESKTRDQDQGIAFDPVVGVASFRDVVQGNTVTISQQPLSDEQKRDVQGFLETVAVNLFAQGSFETNKGTVHYTVPLPDVDPSQTVMFTYKGLLIFIRTQNVEIAPEVWEQYINNLQ